MLCNTLQRIPLTDFLSVYRATVRKEVGFRWEVVGLLAVLTIAHFLAELFLDTVNTVFLRLGLYLSCFLGGFKSTSWGSELGTVNSKRNKVVFVDLFLSLLCSFILA